MKKKIKIFVTIEEKGFFDKIKSFFLKREIKKALNGLRDLPIDEVEELLVTALTQNGYKATKDDKGTTLIKDYSQQQETDKNCPGKASL